MLNFPDVVRLLRSWTNSSSTDGNTTIQRSSTSLIDTTPLTVTQRYLSTASDFKTTQMEGSIPALDNSSRQIGQLFSLSAECLLGKFTFVADSRPRTTLTIQGGHG